MADLWPEMLAEWNRAEKNESTAAIEVTPQEGLPIAILQLFLFLTEDLTALYKFLHYSWKLGICSNGLCFL
jgi:hypothetical protein